MKNLFLIALALVSIQVSAQDKNELQERKQKMARAERVNDYTPEQMAEIQTKQMTLDLDLNEDQQKKVMALNLQNAKDRKSMMEARKEMNKKREAATEISKEDKLKMKNDMLDKQIENKKKMKDILDEKQYAKWEEITAKRAEKMRSHKKAMMKRNKE